MEVILITSIDNYGLDSRDLAVWTMDIFMVAGGGPPSAVFSVLRATGDETRSPPLRPPSRPRPRPAAGLRAALLLALGGGLLAGLLVAPLRFAHHGEPAQTRRLRGSQPPATSDTGSWPELVAGSERGVRAAGPSERYEALRHRVYDNTRDIWFYLKSELAEAMDEGADKERLRAVLREARGRKRSLLADQQRLAAADGHGGWRGAEARAVSILLQARLHRLQHPPDCPTARRLLCYYTKDMLLRRHCGFGCQLHYLAHCLVYAYATRRVLVARGPWLHGAGLAHTGLLGPAHTRLRPLSAACARVDDVNCVHALNDTFTMTIKNLQHPDKRSMSIPAAAKNTSGRVKRGAQLEDAPMPFLTLPEYRKHLLRDIFQIPFCSREADETSKVVFVPKLDMFRPKPEFAPPAVPADLVHRISKFSDDPAAWWVGQMLLYIVRMQPETARAVDAAAAALNYTNPIVGIHIRRTDKLICEAGFHHLHEYMEHAEEHWRQQELLSGRVPPRRVYLASEDPHVLEEARAAYKNVTWLSGREVPAARGPPPSRYTAAALFPFLIDVTLLSRADFLVCTFSSNVCRLVYELMQTNRVDASQSVASVDDVYYFNGWRRSERVAVIAHEPGGDPEQLAFRLGDRIRRACCHQDGIANGINDRTNKSGWFPWYKTSQQLKVYPFPEYELTPDLKFETIDS